MSATIVPMNDLNRMSPPMKAGISDAIERVLSRGRYVLSEECLHFEELFSAYCKVDHCISVGNGTDALELAFRSLDIEDGSRIAMVANAGGYAAIAAQRAGYRPVFVDVDRSTKLIDLSCLAQILSTGGIAAVVATHLYGLMCNMTQICEMTRRTGVKLVEDCAQAHGATHCGKPAGSYGDASCFSFYPTKNLGCLGDGGAITTNNQYIATTARSLRQYGWDNKYSIRHPGGRNSRMDEIQAAVLTAQLDFLEQRNLLRRKIATRYSQEIKNPSVLIPGLHKEEFVAHLYVVVCDYREKFQSYLSSNGINSEIHYPIPDYKQPGLETSDESHLENTEYLTRRALSIPCFPELYDEEVEHVIATINAWV